MSQHNLIVLIIALVLSLTAFASAASASETWSRSNERRSNSANPGWLVGVGMGDITPPIGELNMMGYAKLGQNSRGIQTRLYARAFIFASPSTPSSRIVYISTDSSASSLRIKSLAISYLPALIGNSSSLYTDSNILISSTHTHSGTGGYNDDFLYQVTSFGVYKNVREFMADGIARAIATAHADLEKGEIVDVEVAEGFVADASMNRSPKAYLQNPAQERAKYDANVDQAFPVLNIRPRVAAGEAPRRAKGVVSFFPVHGTSMDNNNELISGDNKGVASQMWEIEERIVNGNKDFVAAFGQANAADVSPNIQGSKCTDTGLPCDGLTGSCGGKIDLCVARGPGYEIGGVRLATRTIAERQYLAAKAATPRFLLSGNTITSRHAYVDMSAITLPNGARTCAPSMGQAFAAGTIDGTVGLTAPNGTVNPALNFLRDLIFTRPSNELLKCHLPKTVLLPTGEVNIPYGWQPKVLPLQVFAVGRGLAFVGVPGEVSTMSGRRIRDAVKEELVNGGVMDSTGVVLLAGLANSYSSYITTLEEYQFQAYEGGSTIFGPNTLNAYIFMFRKLAASISDPSKMVAPGTPPTRNSDIATESPVVLDAPPIGSRFGAITLQPPTTPVTTSTLVRAKYVCAHPRNGAGKTRNGLNGGNTFMTVEKLVNGQWTTVLDDSAFDTTFEWRRDGVAASECEVTWKVGDTWPVTPGTYRFRGFGTSKVIIPFVGDRFTDFSATTNSFVVV